MSKLTDRWIWVLLAIASIAAIGGGLIWDGWDGVANISSVASIVGAALTGQVALTVRSLKDRYAQRAIAQL